LPQQPRDSLFGDDQGLVEDLELGIRDRVEPAALPIVDDAEANGESDLRRG
jgi:hypothetical protein